MTKDRCTGHCCRDFWLSFSPEELMAAYRRWLGGNRERVAMSGAVAGRDLAEIFFIAPMVVYLGYTERTPRYVNPTGDKLLGRPVKGHRYRCKHWDPKTGDCTIYEIRPLMCRDYPGGGKCNYAACTWKSRKAKKETRTERAKRRGELKAGEKKS